MKEYEYEIKYFKKKDAKNYQYHTTTHLLLLTYLPTV